jgi:hypothetical protein
MRCTQVSKYNTPGGSAQPHVARGRARQTKHGGGVQSSVVADESHRTDADVLRNVPKECRLAGSRPGLAAMECKCGCWMVDFSSELFMMFTTSKKRLVVSAMASSIPRRHNSSMKLEEHSAAPFGVASPTAGAPSTDGPDPGYAPSFVMPPLLELPPAGTPRRGLRADRRRRWLRSLARCPEDSKEGGRRTEDCRATEGASARRARGVLGAPWVTRVVTRVGGGEQRQAGSGAC